MRFRNHPQLVLKLVIVLAATAQATLAPLAIVNNFLAQKTYGHFDIDTNPSPYFDAFGPCPSLFVQCRLYFDSLPQSVQQIGISNLPWPFPNSTTLTLGQVFTSGYIGLSYLECTNISFAGINVTGDSSASTWSVLRVQLTGLKLGCKVRIDLENIIVAGVSSSITAWAELLPALQTHGGTNVSLALNFSTAGAAALSSSLPQNVSVLDGCVVQQDLGITVVRSLQRSHAQTHALARFVCGNMCRTR